MLELLEEVVGLAVVDIEVVDLRDQAITLLLLLHKETMVELVFQDLEQVELVVEEEQLLLVLLALLIIHPVELVELGQQQVLMDHQQLLLEVEVEEREQVHLIQPLEELVELVVVEQDLVVDQMVLTEVMEQLTLVVAVVELEHNQVLLMAVQVVQEK